MTGFVDAAEVILPWHNNQFPQIVVAPCMERAGELFFSTAFFTLDDRSPVATGVEKGTKLTCPVASTQDRLPKITTGEITCRTR